MSLLLSFFGQKIFLLKTEVVSKIQVMYFFGKNNLLQVQDDLTKKVKKSQLLVKEEAAQRKELTDKYIA